MNYLKNLLSNYKFDPSKFKLGMRTFKTGLAVFGFINFPFIWMGRAADRNADSCFQFT